MGLIDELGLDSDELEWHQLALCNGTEINWFFDLYEQDEEIAKAIDQTCLACPVMQQCAQFAQENGEFGVWGAVFWAGNGKPDRAKNSHKTPEIWESIYGRIQ